MSNGVSRFTLVSLSIFHAFLVSGCGLESNQSACEKFGNQIAFCVASLQSNQVPFGTNEPLANFCESVPETIECSGWIELASIVTSTACIEWIGSEEIVAELNTVAELLVDNGCFPGLEIGVALDPNLGPRDPCEPLTGFEGCLLRGDCPVCPDDDNN